MRRYEVPHARNACSTAELKRLRPDAADLGHWVSQVPDLLRSALRHPRLDTLGARPGPAERVTEGSLIRGLAGTDVLRAQSAFQQRVE